MLFRKRCVDVCDERTAEHFVAEVASYVFRHRGRHLLGFVVVPVLVSASSLPVSFNLPFVIEVTWWFPSVIFWFVIFPSHAIKIVAVCAFVVDNCLNLIDVFSFDNSIVREQL